MNFELDKEKFGEFITELRKEKGMTQRELAEKLFVSDKAVSKWERGQSLPDITMLNPLADALGVTAAELLNCGKLEENKNIDVSQVGELVEKAISLSDEEKESAGKVKRKRFFIYLACFIIGAAATYYFYLNNGAQYYQSLIVIELLTAIFGAYFMFFVKERLPSYFDDNKISAYSDGFFRLNMPGVYYNNRNWPYIIKNARISLMVIMVALPIAAILVRTFFKGSLSYALVTVFSMSAIMGIFTPIYFGATRH
ncbi:MAG: helix-turn-helix transcriptional regulator [Oscillospiraceae bacterium]|nr:helix-turn-helix transcriptional regulator [Oscillospiraceae bacterium]